MKRKGRLWAALLLCLALLAGCGENGPQATEAAPAQATASAESSALPAATPGAVILPEPEEGSLSLWLARDLPLAESLAALAEDYTAQHPESQLFVYTFNSAEELRAALAQGSPDLLLCDGGRAASLAAEGKLAPSVGELGALRPFFRGAPAGFCPLGGELPVLVVKAENRDRLPEEPTLEELCALASDYGRRVERPFFSADSFAALFAGAQTQKGSPFYAQREQDLESEAYREVYNLLADAAFEGGLVSLDVPVLAAVERGELICGICSSRDLLTADREELCILPLPPMEGCEARTEALLWGLAVPAGEKREEAEAFLAWLLAQPALREAAAEAGLLPACGDDWPGAADFAAALDTGRACCSAENSGYAIYGAKFEQSFRAALALLA